MTPVDQLENVDIKMPAPGDAGYDEWRKTGKLPDTSSEETEETPTNKETPAVSEVPSAVETDVDTPSVETETVTAPEAVRPQQKKRDADARVKELLAQRKEDQKLLREALGKLAKLEVPERPASQVVTEPEKKSAKNEAKPEPQLDDKNADGSPKYTKYVDYQKAWSGWVRDEAIREAKAAASDHTTKTQKEQQTAQAEEVIARVWSGRINEARAKHADYDAVALNPELPIKKGSVTDAFILDSEHGAEVLYHLGSNPQELERIQTLNPLAQARELFRIEQKFATPPKPSPKPAAPKVTQAPNPPHQVTGKPAGNVDEVEQAVKDGDQEAFTRLENERILERARLRQGRRRA
jgi:hypothetical protein